MKLTEIVLTAFLSVQPPQEVKLVDLIAPCIDSTGIVKEEFRDNHYLFQVQDGFAFNRVYLCNGMRIIEQYQISETAKRDGKDLMIDIDNYPSFIAVDGVWYVDFNKDGINGNEERMK